MSENLKFCSTKKNFKKIYSRHYFYFDRASSINLRMPIFNFRFLSAEIARKSGSKPIKKYKSAVSDGEMLPEVIEQLLKFGNGIVVTFVICGACSCLTSPDDKFGS